MPRRTLLVVLNYNGRELVEKCLASMQDLAGRPDVHVLVADNGSTDGSVEMVRERFPWALVRENGSNLGFSGGNNAILANYEADAYVLLNNDIEAHPGWLDAMQAAAQDPRVGVVGAQLLFPDGLVQHAGGVIDARGARHAVYRTPPEPPGAPRDADFITFACAYIKREVLERIGYLDEGYSPIYSEDSDFCVRARKAGFRVVYAPSAVLTHKESVTTGRQPMTKAKLRLSERNRLRLKFIHAPPSLWLRSTWYEAKKWAGNTRDGNLGTFAGAWMDNVRNWREIRSRRRDPTQFTPSKFGPAAVRHAPAVTWEQQDAQRKA